MSLNDRLKTVITGWVESRRGRTLKQLSEETQLNYGTIKNIADGKSDPNGETVLRLLLPILPISEVHLIVSEYFPHMAPYSKTMNELAVLVSTVADLTIKHNRAILELSFGPTEEGHLATILGDGALAIIDDLVEAEICKRNGSRVELTSKEIHFPKQRYAHDVLEIFLANLNISVPGNKLSVRSQTLSAEGVRKAYAAIQKAEEELAAIYADLNLRGDMKFGSALLTTIL